MNVLKNLLLLAAFTLSTLAWASSGATVINRDTKSHILIVEDEDENTTEIVIAAGQTLTNLCKTECYLYLKDAEDFEYLDGTLVTYVIVNGRLASE